MRFSLRLNNDLTLSQYEALAQAAELAGFDQFWVSHDLFLRSSSVILPIVARVTEKMEIGSCIFNPYTINPAELAMFAATMDELSGNRFNLGLAAGAKEFLQWVGLAQELPLMAMRETIGAVRRLLSGEAAALNGRFLQWSPEAFLRFSAPRVTPIYVGAMGPKMLGLAGEMGDGVLPLLFPPEHFFTVKPLVEAGIAVRPDTLSQLDFAACIWVSLSEDREAAKQPLAQKIAYYGSSLGPLILAQLGLSVEDFSPIQHALNVERDEAKAVAMVDDRMLRIGIVGQPLDVIARLEPLVDAGVQHLSFGPPIGPEPLEAVALLGQVIDHFR
ncbi:MAG: LLM class flavin-dependent oxidoreductase [Anaerolineaceae bacterium]|nr:MAG: LLM class flavin-dependent oxidoreductase [Anaerolineaceae bacterium]